MAEPYHYVQQYLGKPRPVRIITIGAGISGIAAVHLFKEKFKDGTVEMVLYDKNEDVGGTWLENRYPGCGCDGPSHGYTYSWKGNPHWSKAYVQSKEIFDYYKGLSVEFGVDQFVRLNHRVIGAIWKDDIGKWSVTITNLITGEDFIDEAEIIINCGGFLNNWRWPEISGLQKFQGKLTHSARRQDWDQSYSFKDKKVAVIGSGSSAIQIVPQIQPIAKHLFSFNRSPTWITPEFGDNLEGVDRSTIYTPEQKKLWAANPSEFLKFRRQFEIDINQFTDASYKGSPAQKAAFKYITNDMKAKLTKKPELFDKLIPKFAVGCRRFSPGQGYLEALVEDNVTVKTEQISEVNEKGIVIKDGSLIELDAIICATGFDTSYRPVFPLTAYGKDLRDVWECGPRGYLSVAAAGFPNYFIIGGPNFPIANGTLVPCLEASLRYAFKAVEKIQKDGIKAMFPKQEAVDEYQIHKDSLMKDMVWSSNCHSWYKSGSSLDDKIWGPWPGSSLHFLELMSNPRWEDWNFDYIGGNRFQFLGHGKAAIQMVPGGDLAYYLSEPGADAPSPAVIQGEETSKYKL